MTIKTQNQKNIIKIINKLYSKGHVIKIYTARYMGRNNDDRNLVNKQGYKKTFNQLKKWGLKFHFLYFWKTII